MTAHVFVIGPHETHAHTFERLEEELDARFHELLAFDLVRKARSYDVEDLLEQAERRLEQSGVRPDAITTYWDFPSSCLAAILCDRYGLPTTSLRSMLACEHKYWARTVQQRVAPHVAPPFQAVDPAADLSLGDLDVEPPLWVKPVKSYSGHLGFLVEREDDLQHALRMLRRRIHRLGEPFNQVLAQVDVPEEVGEIDGGWAVVEGRLDGRQCTVEGHVLRGEVRVHGVFDIHRIGGGGSSFTHYSYPPAIPEHALVEMRAVAAKVLTEIDYDDAPFNVEFFWDHDRDTIELLEINPRISQEHTQLLWYVDGTTNLRIMTELALGREPSPGPGRGAAEVAAKYFVRTTEDAVVQRTPSPGEVEDLEERYAPCRVEVEVRAGDRLSELEDQESYSYELASVYVGAEDRGALAATYDQVRDELEIELAPPAQPTAS